MKNMELWQRVCVTDPQAVKAITGKPYKGHSPKPYWIIRRATEEFGPCGEGWGVEVKSEGFHRMTDHDVMHSAVVTVWYIKDGKRCAIEQMGQTKACYKKADGGIMLDEDAGKKSVTDGMVKCLSMIGFAGDIFSGQWDDNKYVEWAGQETERRLNPVPEKKNGVPILSGKQAAAEDFNSLTVERQQIVTAVSAAIVDHFNNSDIVGAYEEYTGITENDEKSALWGFLPSNIRSALKKHGESLKVA